jgi:hypothetical protein
MKEIRIFTVEIPGTFHYVKFQQGYVMSPRNGLLENNPDGLNRRPGAPQSTDRSTFGTAAVSRDCHVGLIATAA